MPFVAGVLFEVEPTCLHCRNKTLISCKTKRSGSFTILKAALTVNSSGFTHQAEFDRPSGQRLSTAQALQIGEVITLTHLVLTTLLRAALKIQVNLAGIVF